MRTFYDAITPGNIPAFAAGVCGYVDGKYAWQPADWARFPRAVKVRIAVFSNTNDGHVLDVEDGCSSPVNAPGWVKRRRAAGVDPTVYCSLSAWPTVQAAFKSANVTEPHWWIAAYPGNGPNLYPGAIAHQYANPGPVDISVVADYWPGVDPASPAPVGAPAYIGYPVSNGHCSDFLARMIQNRLKALNYPIVVDGDFGNETAKWVGLFQSRHGLKSDGEVGVLTWEALWL